MKKIISTLFASLAVTALSAQSAGNPSWTASLTPVSTASQLGQTHVTVGTDSSVVVTGTYNQPFAFGTTSVPNDDAMTSAYIAKYDKTGHPQWIATLYGSAYVRDIATDAKGNVFAVGALADEVVCTGADGKATTVKGMPDEQATVTGFIARLTANGSISAIRTIYPTADESIKNSGLYAPESGDVKFLPQQVCLSEDSVYVVAQYTGNVNVDNVSWPGSYLNVYDFMYMDLSSFGVMGLKAADLTEARSVAYFQALGDNDTNLTTVQQGPRSMRITYEGSTKGMWPWNDRNYDILYLAYTGIGNNKLQLFNNSGEHHFKTEETASGDTYYSCPIIITKAINDHRLYTSRQLPTPAIPTEHTADYGTDLVQSFVCNRGKGNFFIAGTYYGKCPFDTTKTSQGAADMYVAEISGADFSPVWSATDAFNEGATNNYDEVVTGLAVDKDGKATVVGYSEAKSNRAVVQPLQLTASSTSSELTQISDTIVSIADNGLGIRAFIANSGTTTTVTVTGTQTSTGIQGINRGTAVADNKVYTLDGRYVGKSTGSLPEGVYVVNKKKVVVK